MTLGELGFFLYYFLGALIYEPPRCKGKTSSKGINFGQRWQGNTPVLALVPTFLGLLEPCPRSHNTYERSSDRPFPLCCPRVGTISRGSLSGHSGASNGVRRAEGGPTGSNTVGGYGLAYLDVGYREVRAEGLDP